MFSESLDLSLRRPSLRRCGLTICVLLATFACDDEPAGGGSGGGQEMGGAPMAGAPMAGTPMAGTPMGGAQVGGTPMGGTPAAGDQAGGAQSGGVASGGVDGPLGGDAPPAPEAVCEGSVTLSCDTGTILVSADQAVALTDEYQCGDSFRFPGRELFFEFLEREPHQVSISARPVEQQFSVSYILFALEGDASSCDPGAAPCLATQDTVVQSAVELSYSPERPLWVAIDPRISADAMMDFEIEVRCDVSSCGDGELDEGERCDDGNAEAGDGCDPSCAVEEGYRCEGSPSVCREDVIEGDCAQLLPATEGVYSGDTRACPTALSRISGGCGNAVDAYGPEASYLVTVPAGQQLTASLSRLEGGGFDLARMYVALDPQEPMDSCVQMSSEAFAWLNGAAEDREVLVVVDGSRAPDRGPYELTLSFDEPPQAPGSSCAQPIELSMSGTYMGETVGLLDEGNPHGGAGGLCVDETGIWGYSGGPDQVYRVRLAPGQSLSVSAQATGGWDHTVSIHSDCADFESACLVWDDFGSASVTHSGAEAQDYYILISGFYSYSMGSYNMLVQLD